jgi:hypothetical protein
VRRLALVLLAIATGAEARPGRFGAEAGVFVPVQLRVDGHSRNAAPGPVVVFRLDRPFSDAFDLGGVLDVGGFTADRGDEQVNFFTLGVALHWVAPLEIGTLRVGGGVGYRRLFADARRYDRVNGIALDADVALSHPIAANFTGQVEVGVITQPWGSNGDHRVALLPSPYLAIGAEF